MSSNKQSAEEVKIVLVGSGQTVVEAIFELEDEDGSCKVRCSFDDQTRIAVEADFFESLCSIRRQLEGEGLRPLCYGAVRNAFPSGMARDMGRGLKVYLSKLGVPGGQLVDTFGYADGLVLSSVDEQASFHQQWMKSLG
jgi:hypothetical protein